MAATSVMKALRLNTHLLERMKQIRDWQKRNSRWAPNGNLTESAQIRLLIERGLSHFEQMRAAMEQQQGTSVFSGAELNWRNGNG